MAPIFLLPRSVKLKGSNILVVKCDGNPAKGYHPISGGVVNILLQPF